MKLYRNAEGIWQVPGQQDKKAERVEIDTSSAGLAAFLNELRHSFYSDVGHAMLDAPPLMAEPVEPIDQLLDAQGAVVHLPIERPVMVSEKLAEQAATAFTATEIEDFLLNRATTQQVCNIFECLGSRFAEDVRRPATERKFG